MTAPTPVLGKTYPESDGNAVTVGLTASVVAGQVARAEGWAGIVVAAADSGEYAALNIKGEYQFIVPHSLAVSMGDVVRLDTTQFTGHTPNSGAYNKSAASATNIDLFKATNNAQVTSDGTLDVVRGILIVGAYS